MQYPEKRNLRVLLIEDYPAVRSLVAGLLESLGQTVEEVDGVKSAIADSGPVPDIIVSDVMLPGEQKGPAVAGYLRGRYPEVEVVN